MLANINQLPEKFNALETRLRVLLALMVIVLLYVFFDLFWYSSTESEIKKSQTELKQSISQTNELIAMQDSLNSNVVEKRNDPKSLKIERLNQEINKIRIKLTEKTANLVPAEQMANVVKDIIDSSDKLTLQSLIKQQTIELTESNKSETKERDKNELKLYKHSVEIVLQGSYVSTYEFLQKLERMEKKVTFDHLAYRVDDYPNAEVKLSVSTLSLNKEWIGG